MSYAEDMGYDAYDFCPECDKEESECNCNFIEEEENEC